MENELLDDDYKQEDYPNTNDYDHSLHGLTGWLAFLGFSIIVSFAYTLFSNAKIYLPVFKQFGQFSSLYKILIVLESGLLFLLMSCQLYLLVLYFQKKRLFPKLFVAYLVYFFLFTLFENIIVSKMVNSNYDIVALFRPVVYCSIWLLYIVNSKRVKHTFLY